MKRIILPFFSLIGLFHILLPASSFKYETSDFPEIRGFSIEEKANGTVIRIQCTQKISPNQITGWMSNSGWFYITIMGAIIDTTQEWPFSSTGFIVDFQAQQLEESVQLNFRLNKTIGAFEILTSESPPEIMITLRLPLKESLAVIEKLGEIPGKELSEQENLPDESTTFKNRLPNVLLLTGSAFVIAGLLEPSGVSFIIGSTLILSGYLLKKTQQ